MALTGSVLHEFSWTPVLFVLYDIRERLLLFLPELAIAGALILVLYTLYKFPRRNLALYLANQGVDLTDRALSSATTIHAEEIDFSAIPEDSISANDGAGNEGYQDSDNFVPGTEIDVITEARVLDLFGKSMEAITLLNDAIRQSDDNLDEIALELLKLFEKQFSDPDIDREQLDALHTMRDQLFEYLSKKIRNISSETWFLIYEKYPRQINLNARHRVLETGGASHVQSA
jgi:hypothetical protein